MGKIKVATTKGQAIYEGASINQAIKAARKEEKTGYGARVIRGNELLINWEATPAFKHSTNPEWVEWK